MGDDMKQPLTGYGWLVVIIVFLAAVGAFVVGARHGWYWGAIPIFIGLLMCCLLGAVVTPKRRAK